MSSSMGKRVGAYNSVYTIMLDRTGNVLVPHAIHSPNVGHY